ncbi:MAG: zinc ribbon domain-containing protein [candidate division WOR-3 bacterium]|nr:MAG: zinc ribbon domain-containing protein [candidate division WOR-3 bacterium]
MPTYEFKCKKCGKEFEEFTTISGKNKVKCPKCKSSSLCQVFTTVQVRGAKGNSGCKTCSSSSCTTCGTSK